MSHASFKSCVGLLALGLTLVFANASAQQAGGNADAKKLKNPVKVTPESITAGKAVYAKYCGFCHKADATGNGPLAPKGMNPPDLIDDKWDHGSTDGEIFVSIRDGIGPKFDMKANKEKIKEQDIWNVVSYLRSLEPKK